MAEIEEDYNIVSANLHDPEAFLNAIEPIYDFFQDEYKTAHQLTTREAVQNAAGSLNGQLGIKGCKVRRYLASRVINPEVVYRFDLNSSELQDQVRKATQTAEKIKGASSKKGEPKLVLDTLQLLCAQIPTNREAEDHFKDKPHVPVISEIRPLHDPKTNSIVSFPSITQFYHHQKYQGDYCLVPLELKISRDWAAAAQDIANITQDSDYIGEIKTGGVDLEDFTDMTNESHLLHENYKQVLIIPPYDEYYDIKEARMKKDLSFGSKSYGMNRAFLDMSTIHANPEPNLTIVYMPSSMCDMYNCRLCYHSSNNNP